jgi:hypothetical protein
VPPAHAWSRPQPSNDQIPWSRAGPPRLGSQSERQAEPEGLCPGESLRGSGANGSGLGRKRCLSLEEVAKRGERPNPVADDLGYRQQGHGEDGARNAPHPEPEDERQDDENRIEGEPSRQEHRR